mgnify:CR=1 FL=1
MLLVVVFDERSSLGLVKLRVKQAGRELALIFDEVDAGIGGRVARRVAEKLGVSDTLNPP